MGLFIKKPIIIEASQWFRWGDHPEVSEFRWHPETAGDFHCPECNNPFNIHGWIETLEGGYRVCPGDWIVRGVAGEFYPCKDKIFKQTYEEVL